MTKFVGNAATVTADWRAAMEQAKAASVQTVPKGWITMRQYKELIGKSISGAQAEMQLLVSTGQAESKKFLVIFDALGIRSIPHYRLKRP